MGTYRYKANNKQGKTLMVMGPIMAIVGAGLLLSPLVIQLGYGDNAPSLGLVGTKIVWTSLVILGVFSVVIGYRATQVRDQRIQIADDAVTVPTGEFSNEMVTLRRGDITSLKTFASAGTRSLVIKYNGGKTRLINHRFDSPDDYDAMVAGVSAVAGMPAVRSKL